MEKNQQGDNIDLKKGFFKKAKMSIFNIEKYPELAAEGIPRAISYLVKMVAILAVVICIGMMYKASNVINQGIDYIENNFPDFSYQDGILDVKNEEPIIIQENEYFGKLIVDTKTEDSEKINQYTNEITEAVNGIAILKDKIIIKNEAMVETAIYQYNELLGTMGITKFEKQDIINFAKGSQMINLYISLFITLFVYTVIIYFLNTLINVLLISVFGYFASLFAKVRMRYAAIFNMSVYAITLSMILNIIYVIINIFVNFNIQYFDVMYISVAVIYLFAAIFMIKEDLLRKQEEISKIIEVQKEVKKEIENKEKEDEKEKREENKKDDKKQEKEKEEDTKDKDGPTPEGTNA